MNAKATLFLTLLFFSAVSFADEGADEDATGPSDVVVLTDADFQKTLADNAVVLLEFYAPWCGHCKHLAPIYEQVATKLKGKTVVAKIDATENQAAAQEYNIKSFPTIFLVKDNGQTRIPYQGPRDVDSMVSFIERAQQPSMVSIETAEALTAFKAENSLNVIGCFAEENELFTLITKESYLTATHKYASIKPELMPGVECPALISNVPGIAESFTLKVTPEMTKEALYTWINVHTRPLLEEIGPHNFRTYLDIKVPLVWLICANPADESSLAARKVFEGLASKFYEKLSFIWLDDSKYHQQSNALGYPAGHAFPWVVITKPDSPVRHVVPDTVTLTDSAAVSAFVDQYLEGKVARNIKSQPEPAEAKEGQTVTIVGTNFERIVKDDSKDVFVKIYAQWCGHCQALAPVYDELAKVMASVKSLVIADMDGPENDAPDGIEIRGFPTLLFFPAGAKSTPLTYEGDRSLADMVKFVHDNAAVKFEIPKEAVDAVSAAATKAEQEEATEETDKEEL